MKILIFALENTYEAMVPRLEADGHEVRLLSKCNGTPLLLGTSEGKAYVSQQITEFAPDLVINAVPSIVLPTSSDYTYLGNTSASARLETYKWETREKAAELGWSVPTVLEECNMNTMSTYDKAVYLKPKGLNPWNQVWKIAPGTTYNTEFPSGIPAYVEESIEDYAVEAFCFFTISNGSYSISRIMGCTGFEGFGKTMEDGAYPFHESQTYLELTDAQRDAFLPKCTAWLDYIVTLGGNYEGAIEGLINDSNEVYWLEQNSRPFTYNNGSIPGTIQDWIDSLTTDPSKSVNPNYFMDL